MNPSNTSMYRSGDFSMVKWAAPAKKMRISMMLLFNARLRHPQKPVILREFGPGKLGSV